MTADRRKVLRAIGENVSRVALALLLGAFIVIAWRFEFKWLLEQTWLGS